MKISKVNIAFFAKVLLALIVLVIIGSLQSCITEKHRERICATCPVVNTVKDSIVYKHDTVPVYLPPVAGPTVYLENPCQSLCDSIGRLKPFNINHTVNGISVKVFTQGNRIAIEANKKDSTLRVPVTHKEAYHEVNKTIQMPCENERTGFDYFCRWFFYIVAILAALAVFWQYIRPKIKPKTTD